MSGFASLVGTELDETLSGDWAGPANTRDHIRGDGGDDTLTGGISNDTLLGEVGIDSIAGGDGADSLYGGTDDDVIQGGNDDDRLFGEAQDDTLEGGEGWDTLDGGAGNDLLRGGEGGDLVLVEDGADTLVGGGGDDTLHSGTGPTTFYYESAGSFGDDLIDGFTPGTDILHFEPNMAGTGIASPGDLLAYVAPDGSGGTLISLPGGSIHLLGIDPADIGADPGAYFKVA